MNNLYENTGNVRFCDQWQMKLEWDRRKETARFLADPGTSD
jgi:hypothetical protein